MPDATSCTPTIERISVDFPQPCTPQIPILSSGLTLRPRAKSDRDQLTDPGLVERLEPVVLQHTLLGLDSKEPALHVVGREVERLRLDHALVRWSL